MSVDDDAYFAGCEARERLMAERAENATARISHAQMADLYAAKLGRQVPLVQPRRP